MTNSTVKGAAHAKAFLGSVSDFLARRHIYGKPKRRASRNPSREVTVQKERKNTQSVSTGREKGDPKCVRTCMDKEQTAFL